jgi:DNA invertase Pin-like site-specific DNA recombinase
MLETSKRRGGRVLVDYARTPTFDQTAGFEAQRRDLAAAGCTKIFAGQVSSVAEREQLKAAMDYLREDDVLVATKLDRLARSMPAFSRSWTRSNRRRPASASSA